MLSALQHATTQPVHIHVLRLTCAQVCTRCVFLCSRCPPPAPNATPDFLGVGERSKIRPPNLKHIVSLDVLSLCHFLSLSLSLSLAGHHGTVSGGR